MFFHSQLLLLMQSLVSVIMLHSCGEIPKAKSPNKKINYDNWKISGKVSDEHYGGGDVLALALDGIRYRSRIDASRAFQIELPGNASYALYFLEKERNVAISSNTDDFLRALPSLSLERKEALLNYEDSPDVGMRKTLRLPKVLFNNNINLGQIDIKNGEAFPTINPALSLDFDYDGIKDFADLDDQNDLLNDLDQQKDTERVDICHADEQGQEKTLSVALSDLYVHVKEGDGMGPCMKLEASLTP